MTPFAKLFQPGMIGHLRVANRIVMPAITTGLASINGEITPEILAYYRERALSGPGIIVAEVASVEGERGRYGHNSIMGNHPRYTAGLARLAETLKIGGARAFIQLYHVGRQTSLKATGGRPPLSPSAIFCKPMHVMPEAASISDIADVTANFVDSAQVLKSAGFDGVELHAGHGYLLSSFLSPFTNQREDEYGGSTENRVRIVKEIIASIKATVPGLIVGVRFNICDFVPEGIDQEEGLRIASLLEMAGADYLNVSSGMYESSETIIEPVNYTEGWRVHLGALVKKQVKIPVIVGGVIRHPEMAEQILADEKADFVFIGRAQVADPRWIEKTRAGKSDSIRPCLSCNVCIERSMKGRSIACTINPRVGRETWLPAELPRTSDPKSILVVGGGPAGMAVAARLAERGHYVILVEKEAQLGGLLDAAATPPDKYRVAALARHLSSELQVSGAEIRLNTNYSPELVRDIQPDAVVVAAGSMPKQGSFYAADDPTVVQAIDVLRQGAEPEMSYLVAGGGITGCETALYLGRLGHKVTLAEVTSSLARGLQQVNRQELIKALKKCGVQLLTGVHISQYSHGRATIVGDQESQAITVDRLVLALGFEPLRGLAAEIESTGIPVYLIGDNLEPRSIETALYEAEILAGRL